jgi:hypothetical protein
VFILELFLGVFCWYACGLWDSGVVEVVEW